MIYSLNLSSVGVGAGLVGNGSGSNASDGEKQSHPGYLFIFFIIDTF